MASDEMMKFEELNQNPDISSSKVTVNEYEVTLHVDEHATSPKKSEVFYNKDVASNRTLITTALAVYAKSGKSCFYPIRCLDGIGASGVMGLLWKKYINDDIVVTINDSHLRAYETIKENTDINKLEVEILNKDTCALLHENTYNFISLDCHANAAYYLESALRNLPKDGIVAFTTTDDSALHAVTSENALRNYGGFIIRTFYSKELAVRLFLAAVAKTAAKYNKGIHVLLSVALKSSFTVIFTVKRGSAHANKSIKNVRKLIHCSMCEDRAFYPLSNYPIESPLSLLGCGCSRRLPGKVAMELGPIWSGSIFNEDFLVAMYHQSTRFPWKIKAEILLGQLIAEAKCSTKNDTKLSNVMGGGKTNVVKEEHDDDEDEAENPAKRMKVESSILPEKREMKSKNILSENTTENEKSITLMCLDSEKEPAPPFYFNLHRHSPKGPKLLRVDTVIQFLHKAGYKASRTHFDREAVRTNASLSNLVKVLTEASNVDVH